MQGEEEKRRTIKKRKKFSARMQNLKLEKKHRVRKLQAKQQKEQFSGEKAKFRKEGQDHLLWMRLRCLYTGGIETNVPDVTSHPFKISRRFSNARPARRECHRSVAAGRLSEHSHSGCCSPLQQTKINKMRHIDIYIYNHYNYNS